MFTRRRFRSALAAGLAVAVIALAGPAHAEVDKLVTGATALHAQGKAGEAYQMLLPEQGRRAGDPDYDYILGLSAADVGQYGAAIIALQRVLAMQPGNAPARAELARAYALAGDIDTAKAEFDTVVADPTIPDPVRNRFNRLARDYDQQIKGGPDSMTGFLEAEGGYDSNINTATDATSITLPVFAFFGPASLNGAATSQDKPFYQIQGGVSGSTPLGRQTRAFLSVLGSWRDNLGSSLFDQASLTGTSGISHDLATGDAISLSGQLQRFWLDQHGYRTSYGVLGQYTHRLDAGRALAFGLQYYRLDYDGRPLNDADRVAGTVTYAGKFVYAGIGGGKESTIRKGARQLGYGFASAQAGTEYPLSESLALLAGAGIEYRNYSATDPLFLKSRSDWQLDASLGLRVALGKGFSVRPRVTYTRNESNLALYDYDRWTASLGLRLEF